MTAALEGGEWSAARPGRTLLRGKTRYPFYRRLGGPQGRSGRTEKSRPHLDSIPNRPVPSQSLYRLSCDNETFTKYMKLLYSKVPFRVNLTLGDNFVLHSLWMQSGIGIQYTTSLGFLEYHLDSTSHVTMEPSLHLHVFVRLYLFWW